MDRASVLGIVSGFILLLWGMSNGGDLRMFWDFASVLITVGGTLTATLISYRLSTFLEVMSIAKNAFVSQEQDISETINTIVRFADKARREGLLALDQDADALDDPFLQKGIRLVVDGTTPELVRNILETELAFIAQRHKMGQSLFETMGAFAPAFGMVGTLIGLIQMLVNLDAPEAIGPGMATALVTTFYGSVLANLVFLPIANKLKNKSAAEIFRKEAIIEGVLSIQAGDNPRIVQEKLKSFVSPKKRSEIQMPSRLREVPGSEIPLDVR
ncbi:MAG TPA: motility protein A [Bacillota bacterium]|nr:motility protein A [Bacillota bacterium]HPT35101.1 motility protein A [Bacillota bacterium]